MRVTSDCACAAVLREQKSGIFRCSKELRAPLVVWMGCESRHQAAAPGRRRASPKNKTQTHLPMVLVLKMYARW